MIHYLKKHTEGSNRGNKEYKNSKALENKQQNGRRKSFFINNYLKSKGVNSLLKHQRLAKCIKTSSSYMLSTKRHTLDPKTQRGRIERMEKDSQCE